MKRIGKRTIIFENKPRIISYGSVVGKKEHEGPLSNEFDSYTTDSFFGEKSFEKAESKLLAGFILQQERGAGQR